MFTDHNPAFSFFLAFVTTFACGPASGGVYKCTSPDGEVYYSDVACPTDFQKRELRIDSTPAKHGRGAPQYDPYSVVEQARRIDERKYQEERDASINRARQRISAHSDANRAQLRSIEEKLHKVEKKILSLTADRNGQSGIRARWTREELAEARLEKSQLLRERENILGLTSAPRDHRANTSAPRGRTANTPSIQSGPQWLHDPFSGRMMPRSGAGYVDPRSGTFYHDVGPGVVNTRTGEFTPTN